MTKITIAVDCMSGDKGVDIALQACNKFLQSNKSANLLLVGDQQQLAKLKHPRVQIIHTIEVVTMQDSIEIALRRKKQSSMRLAIEQVKTGQAQVAISAGNTGAMMALSRYLLKTIPGIDRPAIAFPLPNIKGKVTTVLDLGANVDCTAEHLLQFAILGSALDTVIKSIDNPSVGLLNIGAEDIKGNEAVKDAYKLLTQVKRADLINFYGNTEGDDIFKGTTEVVVCDGFVGNVALKTIEGVANMMSQSLKAEFNSNIFSRLAGLVSYPILAKFKQRFDHRSYNGAALLGLRGLVFKSHGSADAFAFECALHRAYQAVDKELLQQISSKVAKVYAILPKET